MRRLVQHGFSALLVWTALASGALAQEREPNNGCVSAQDAGASDAPRIIDGSLDLASAALKSDVDYFRFAGEPGSRLQVRIGERAFDRATLAAFDEQCAFLAGADFDGGLRFAVPQSGQFSIGVASSTDRWLNGRGRDNAGPYALVFDPAPLVIGSISGRLVDARTGGPLVSPLGLPASVALRRCAGETCSRDLLTRVNADATGRFRIDRGSDGRPIEEGMFELSAIALDYDSTSVRFTAAARADVDLLDLALTRPAFQISNVTPCQIPAEGGRCEYTFGVRNDTASAQVGTVFSIVRVGNNGLVSFEASARPGADPERAVLAIPAAETRDATFGFDVPASLPNGTELCAQIFVGTGPTPVFQVKGLTPFAFCMRKDDGGFPVLGSEESQRVLERMDVPPR